MEIITKKRFEKDIKRMKKRGKDFTKLERILNILVSGDDLDAACRPHLLVGNWRPCMELHIEPDWLLIYFVDHDAQQLTLFRTGTHSDLF